MLCDEVYTQIGRITVHSAELAATACQVIVELEASTDPNVAVSVAPLLRLPLKDMRKRLRKGARAFDDKDISEAIDAWSENVWQLFSRRHELTHAYWLFHPDPSLDIVPLAIKTRDDGTVAILTGLPGNWEGLANLLVAEVAAGRRLIRSVQDIRRERLADYARTEHES